MKNRFYIGLIVFAVLMLALGRLIVRPPVAVLATRRRRHHQRFSRRLSARFLPT
jgi:hypothetical protein